MGGGLCIMDLKSLDHPLKLNCSKRVLYDEVVYVQWVGLHYVAFHIDFWMRNRNF